MSHAITPTATQPIAKPDTSATTQRRMNRPQTPVAPQPTVVDLALQIADSTARSDIEVYCAPVVVDQREWYDTRQVIHATHPSDRGFIGLALAYLSQRRYLAIGYLPIFHATAPHLVRFEAKA